ncbi:flagellar filament capping protein FliD [Bacillus cereus]|nr:flagellar filament capping protein FliD [Bacillus cereus]PGU70466.1 flagellar filament capping protein FliD [Bacillus cereus]
MAASTISGVGGYWNLGNNMIDISNFVELEINALEMKKSPYLQQKNDLSIEKDNYTAMKQIFGNFVQIFKDVSAFKGNEKSTILSQDGFIKAQANSSAIPGKYTIEVQKVAERHQITTDTNKKINLDDPIGADDTFEIDGKPVEVTKDMTYKDLVNKINNGNYGVSAYSLGGQLFFTSTTAGEDGAIKLKDGNNGFLNSIGLINADGSIANEITKASNAEYTINGISETSTSNKIESLPGVTINLEKVTDKPITLTIEDSNIDASINLIKKMKDEYNKAVSEWNRIAGKNQPMQGTNIAFTLQNAMTSMFTYSKDDNFLFTFGIQVDQDGNMTIDEEKLKDVFKEDEATAKQFFFGSNGIGHEMEKKLEGIFGDQGIIGERSKSIDEQINKLNAKIADIDTVNKQRQTEIVKKYADLESKLALLDMQLKTMQAMTKTKKDD